MPLESLQNGRYHIVRPLGSGSMGEVYLVDDTRIDRQVAIKVIRFDASAFMNTDATQDAVRLFEREAKAIAQLNHPNILPLFDYGEEVVNGATVTYMVMPYCPDGSLSTWLQQHAQDDMLSPQATFHFTRQAADALQHAHDHDIIHQDVKPSNFLIRKRNGGLPDILLADFGIARLAASSSGASQVVRGTPVYMAPEQWEGHPVPASDQYALAVMVYQLLTGRTPFQGGPSQMMYQHMTVSPMPPSAVNTALSPAVDSVLLRALAKRPQDRFPTVAAFADALQETLPTIDHPTIVNTMGHLQYDDNRPTMMSAANLLAQDGAIRATLAISAIEAANGTRRALTLPSGQRITVSVPPGVQNGQVLRIGEQDGTLVDGNLADPMLLTIAVAPGYNPGAAVVARDDKTIINPDPLLLANADQPTVQGAAFDTVSSQPTVLQQQYPPAQENFGQMSPPLPPFEPLRPRQPVPPRPSSPGRLILLIAIVVILLLASTAFLIFFLTNNNATNNANGTATAQANGSLAATSTALAQANQTGTALTGSNATATANAQATAIGVANVNATATANAGNANATATANAQANARATATANAQANANATATAQANATASATATTHPVISNGTGTIQGTFQFNFDTGMQVNSNGDVFWNQIDSTQRQMVPEGSATIVNLGSVNFDTLDFTTLQGESYSTNPIDGNNDSSNQLVNGDVFAVHTNGGNYAKVMVVNYGYNIQIKWVTYHG